MSFQPDLKVFFFSQPDSIFINVDGIFIENLVYYQPFNHFHCYLAPNYSYLNPHYISCLAIGFSFFWQHISREGLANLLSAGLLYLILELGLDFKMFIDVIDLLQLKVDTQALLQSINYYTIRILQINSKIHNLLALMLQLNFFAQYLMTEHEEGLNIRSIIIKTLNVKKCCCFLVIVFISLFTSIKLAADIGFFH